MSGKRFYQVGDKFYEKRMNAIEAALAHAGITSQRYLKDIRKSVVTSLNRDGTVEIETPSGEVVATIASLSFSDSKVKRTKNGADEEVEVDSEEEEVEVEEAVEVEPEPAAEQRTASYF